MEYILTERQFEIISKRLVSEQDKWWEKSSYMSREWDKATTTLNNLDPHTLLQVAEIGTAFIPVVGPMISMGIGLADAALYYKEGDKKSAALTAAFSMIPGIATLVKKIPGVKELGEKGMAALASKISKGSKTFTKEEVNIINNINKSSDEVISEVQKKFDLSRANRTSKKPRDYGKIKISDNLVMITKPRWKDYVAQVVNVKNADQHMDLKKGTDKLGEFYYLSTKMENSIDAGKSLKELIKKIPQGARFGEPATGSLSTDSFYNMLRRVKSFEPKVIGRIRLNKSGVKRFQEFIKNPIESNEYPPILRFKNLNDAKPLLDAINSEIKKVGLSTSATISKNSDGLFEILIPNIQLRMK
jgi:hypothetical protein